MTFWKVHFMETPRSQRLRAYVKKEIALKAIIGKKIGMTQILDKNGNAIAITLVQAAPNAVTQIKTIEKDGYEAVQIGGLKKKGVKKPQIGHAAKAIKGFTPSALREVRGVDLGTEELSVGSKLEVSNFEEGDEVDVTGVSKGKGFAGTVKRWNFNTSKKTHGGKGYIRRPGSIGSMYPQKVFKGKKMAGRMGHDTVTQHDLKVAFVDGENNLLGIKGALPGARGSLVFIRESK